MLAKENFRLRELDEEIFLWNLSSMLVFLVVGAVEGHEFSGVVIFVVA